MYIYDISSLRVNGSFCSYISIREKNNYTHLQNCEKRLLDTSCLSVCLSVRMELLCFHWKDFHKNPYVFFKKYFLLKSNTKSGTLHTDQYTFVIICRSVLLIMKNVWSKICGKIQNTHFLFNTSNVPFRKTYRLWDNMENIIERGRPQMTIRRMRVAYWIPKATNTHSQYVVLIAFPLQQWLYESPSMLRYTYMARIVVRYYQGTPSDLYLSVRTTQHAWKDKLLSCWSFRHSSLRSRQTPWFAARILPLPAVIAARNSSCVSTKSTSGMRSGNIVTTQTKTSNSLT